ncbi:hypothetical protein ACFYYB_05330 [Streptomyces sp. NPDC002886]|uniref:hypothetical protein n=1 Tax=Streptomyces sp. NPDC002886 TaxID=3364667 RepID=UPI003699557E
METATSQVIGQLSGYMRGLTQRLDPGAGWYGEFLRRDPQGMRACLDGAAMPPWDVLESLLGDLAASTGATALARETQYAAGLRAAAVGIWDRLPGGVEELRTLLASAAEQRAQAREGLRVLSALLAETADPAQAQALSRELSWIRDDAARAAARHDDLTARLEAVAPGTAVRPEGDWPGHPAQARPEPLNSVPAQRAAPSPGVVPAGAWPGPRGADARPGSRDAEGSGGPAHAQGGAAGAVPGAGPGPASGRVSGGAAGAVPGRARDAASDATGIRAAGAESAPTSTPASGAASGPVPTTVGEPVGRAEGRWLRGARRSGGARYAGAAMPEAEVVTVPPGHPSSTPPLRGARFGRPTRASGEPASAGEPGSGHAAPHAGSEGPLSGHPSAAAGEGGHAGSGPTGGQPAAAQPEAAWSPAAAWPDGDSDSDSTGQGDRRPTTPAWSTGHDPAPGSGPAPGSDPAPGRAPAPGWASASGSGPRPHPQGEPDPWPDRAPDGSTHWPAPPTAAGPHGGAGVWDASTSAADPHGAPAPWQASAAGPQGVSGGSAPGGSPHGGPAQWGGVPRGFVEGLVALRAQGRSGEAHALLCEAAAGPAEQLVRLGEELGRAGLAADWASLLWEAASLPPARFAAAAAALGPADREALLRQGAARPAAEIAEAALVLAEGGHTPEADALLAAFVRVRTAEESARLARRDPRWFAPRLIRAAEALSGAHHRDLLHALRVANLPVA